jgi:exodeoxyribonuclease VII large subunit
LAVPVRAELMALLDELSARKRRCLTKRARDARERLALTACRWPAGEALLGPRRQRLDEVGERLPRGLAARAHKAEAVMNLTAARLSPRLLHQKLERLGSQLDGAAKMLPLVHPDRPLARGFVRVTAAEDGRTLTQAEAARAAGLLLLRFGDGEVAASTESVSAPPTLPKVERAARRPYVPPQPNLFD